MESGVKVCDVAYSVRPRGHYAVPTGNTKTVEGRRLRDIANRFSIYLPEGTPRAARRGGPCLSPAPRGSISSALQKIELTLCEQNAGRTSLEFVVADVGFAADSKHAQEKGREDDLYAEKEPHGPEKDLAYFEEITKTTGSPFPGNPGAAAKTDEEDQSANKQATFESDAFQKTSEGNCAAVKSCRVAEHLGEGADGENLRSEKSEDDTKHHSVNVQSDARSQFAGTGEKPKNKREANEKQKSARNKIEPIGGIHEHETQASPTIAETAEMGRTSALVRPQDDRNFRDAGADLTRLYDKFESEFHS